MGTKIKLYASILYLSLTSLPTFFVLIGSGGIGVPVAIVHFIFLAMIILWFARYELK